MFWLGILLSVPMILATEEGANCKICVYFVQNTSDLQNTVERIEVVGSPRTLNLSCLDIKNFTENAFKNVSFTRDLNLYNNSLSKLQETTFASLTNLEKLDLSHNKIFKIRQCFAHLKNLKHLDLSYNRIKSLQASDFFGLTVSCVIFVKGNYISYMSTKLFKNKSHRNLLINKRRQKRAISFGVERDIKICINDGVLISVEQYTKGEEFSSGCSSHRYREDEFSMSLSSLDIVEFKKGWYKQIGSSISTIDLSNNRITRPTSQIFNDLPENISSVDLSNNVIVRLEKNVIMNACLQEIHFDFNDIIEIEDDVFINTSLRVLNLQKNNLKDTKFAATLPLNLTEINLHSNEITEIWPESFSKLNNLETLTLSSNRIRLIYRDSLSGLTGLKTLQLENNIIQSIEADSFKYLKNLTYLYLSGNKLHPVVCGEFAHLKNIISIQIDSNELWKLERDTFNDLPKGLERLYLQYNKIRKLKTGTFVNSPTKFLSLSHNSISHIENESLNLTYLRNLELRNNSLEVVENVTFQSLEKLEYLNLSMNNITKIEKGSFKNSVYLCDLYLSGNPIKELERGALHGLRKDTECNVQLVGVPIEIIHGGVFDSFIDSSFVRSSKVIT